MLSASVLSTACVAYMLSPSKNPCRVRVQEATQAASSWYRYDPYVSKVLPSPMKTAVSPQKPAAPAPEQAAKNSLFAAPLKPSSFVAAVERATDAAVRRVAPQPVAAFTLSTTTTITTKRPTAESNKTHYAIIRFKHDSATFIAPFRIAVGDHVIVEGDRGEDLGVVEEITTETPHYPVPSKIVRRASSRDRELLSQKQLKEQRTVREVQDLAATLGLPIHVVDTEFQFDMNKLTVYFDAPEGHTDFRKLQRGLFREHRCRIWLSNMAEVEYNAKLQQTRRTR